MVSFRSSGIGNLGPYLQALPNVSRFFYNYPPGQGQLIQVPLPQKHSSPEMPMEKAIELMLLQRHWTCTVGCAEQPCCGESSRRFSPTNHKSTHQADKGVK